MKVKLIYDNNVISTNIQQPLRVRDLVINLKKFFNKPDTIFTLLTEKQKVLNENEIIPINPDNELVFYVVSCPIYKKNSTENEPKIEQNIEELIMKATGAKEKISKRKNTSERYQSISDRLAVLQSITSSLNQPIQNQPTEISNLMAMLRNLEENALDNDTVMDFLPQVTINRSDNAHNAENTTGSRVPRYHPYSRQPVEPNNEHLRQLKEMGFPEDRCRRALILSRNNINRATDMLLNDELDYLPPEAENNNQEGDDQMDEMEYHDEQNNENSNNQGSNP